MIIGNINACCVTGHRDIPIDKRAFVEHHLRNEIEAAIVDGYRLFISGMADGADLLFTKLIIEYRAIHMNLFLEAALPYPGWQQKGADYNGLLSQCNGIQVHSAKYAPNCFLIRNRYMVDTCDRIIAVYDGRGKGGTFNTIQYADALNRDIRMIQL